MKKMFLILILLTSFFAAKSQYYPERIYQLHAATALSGSIEYLIAGGCRVDIVTDTFAIEVEFPVKWAEAIGQSLYYAEIMNKQPGIILIRCNLYNQESINRVIFMAVKLKIQVWIIDHLTLQIIRIKTI